MESGLNCLLTHVPTAANITNPVFGSVKGLLHKVCYLLKVAGQSF